jgi:cbb3-type cytochrome oxidase subunit 1
MTIVQTLPTLTPYFIVRAIGGGIVVVSAYLFAVDIIMTIISKRKMQPETSEIPLGGAAQ